MKFISDNHGKYVQTARAMRHDATEAERILWNALRGKQLAGLKFYRQRVIGSLIADFYCAAARLVIEIDGDTHNFQKDYDAIRAEQFEDHGYKVIRFTNDEVLNNLADSLIQIELAVKSRISDLTPGSSSMNRKGAAPPPLKSGEGVER